MSKGFYIQRLGLMVIAWLFITISNVVGYGMTLLECMAGGALLCAIGLGGLYFNHWISRWIKLPSMLFVALFGLLLACPLSPIHESVIHLANQSNFMAPTAALGAFSGITLGKDFKEFAKAGWKYVVVTLLIIAGSFFFSALVAQIVLKLTGVI